MGLLVLERELGNIDIRSVLILLIFLLELRDLKPRSFDRIAHFEKLSRLLQIDRIDRTTLSSSFSAPPCRI